MAFFKRRRSRLPETMTDLYTQCVNFCSVYPLTAFTVYERNWLGLLSRLCNLTPGLLRRSATTPRERRVLHRGLLASVPCGQYFGAHLRFLWVFPDDDHPQTKTRCFSAPSEATLLAPVHRDAPTIGMLPTQSFDDGAARSPLFGDILRSLPSFHYSDLALLSWLVNVHVAVSARASCVLKCSRSLGVFQACKIFFQHHRAMLNISRCWWAPTTPAGLWFSRYVDSFFDSVKDASLFPVGAGINALRRYSY